MSIPCIDELQEANQRFEVQDVFFPKPLVKPNSSRRELFIGYGHLAGVYLTNTSGQLPISQKQNKNILENGWTAKIPTLPVSSTALQVDYPFKDRVMGEHIANIKKSRSLSLYIRTVQGSWLSKIPFNQLKPLQRVISAMEEDDYDIKDILKNQATPILRNYILDYPNLLTANIETYNSEYVGGCLTVLKNEPKKKSVCFASGSHFDKLSIHELVPDDNDNSIYQHNNGVDIDIGSGIYEVQSAVIRDTGYCGIRCKGSKCLLMRFKDDDYSTTLNTIETVDERPTSICLSPNIEGESLIATDTGTVHIWSVGRGLKAVILNKATRFKCNDNWRQVHYGGCPQEIILTDKTVIQMFDRRTRCDSSVDLFALPNKILLNSERITTSCKHPVNPYQHLISTDNSLILLDHRFPQHCVMYWNHVLGSCPGLISVYHERRNNVDNSIVLLSSHYPPETCCFQFQQSSPNPVYSKHTPWRLSKISDICEYESPMLNTYSLLSKKRLDTSLCGNASVSGDDANSFLTLQLDCHGELFYQVYSSSYNNDDITCSAGPGFNKESFSSNAQAHAKLWMSSLERHVGRVCEENQLLKTTTADYSHKFYALRQTDPAHVLCPQCLPVTIRDANCHDDENKDDDDDDEDEDDDKNMCASCNLSIMKSKSLFKASTEDRIAEISSDGYEMLNSQIPPYSKLPHDSAKSSILIKLWEEDDPDISLDVVKADKDVKKCKKRYDRAVLKLSKTARKREKQFRTLRHHGHDMNHIYFDNRKNPSALDNFVRELAALYDGDVHAENTASIITETTKTTFSQDSNIKGNLTLLARESQNLSLLQILQSSSDSHSHADNLSVMSDIRSPEQTRQSMNHSELLQKLADDSDVSSKESTKITGSKRSQHSLLADTSRKSKKRKTKLSGGSSSSAGGTPTKNAKQSIVSLQFEQDLSSNNTTPMKGSKRDKPYSRCSPSLSTDDGFRIPDRPAPKRKKKKHKTEDVQGDSPSIIESTGLLCHSTQKNTISKAQDPDHQDSDQKRKKTKVKTKKKDKLKKSHERECSDASGDSVVKYHPNYESDSSLFSNQSANLPKEHSKQSSPSNEPQAKAKTEEHHKRSKNRRKKKSKNAVEDQLLTENLNHLDTNLSDTIPEVHGQHQSPRHCVVTENGEYVLSHGTQLESETEGNSDISTPGLSREANDIVSPDTTIRNKKSNSRNKDSKFVKCHLNKPSIDLKDIDNSSSTEGNVVFRKSNRLRHHVTTKNKVNSISKIHPEIDNRDLSYTDESVTSPESIQRKSSRLHVRTKTKECKDVTPSDSETMSNADTVSQNNGMRQKKKTKSRTRSKGFNINSQVGKPESEPSNRGDIDKSLSASELNNVSNLRKSSRLTLNEDLNFSEIDVTQRESELKDLPTWLERLSTPNNKYPDVSENAEELVDKYLIVREKEIKRKSGSETECPEIDSIKQEPKVEFDDKLFSESEESLSLKLDIDSSQNSDANSVFSDIADNNKIKIEHNTDSNFIESVPPSPNSVSSQNSIDHNVPDISRHNASLHLFSPVLLPIINNTQISNKSLATRCVDFDYEHLQIEIIEIDKILSQPPLITTNTISDQDSKAFDSVDQDTLDIKLQQPVADSPTENTSSVKSDSKTIHSHKRISKPHLKHISKRIHSPEQRDTKHSNSDLSHTKLTESLPVSDVVGNTSSENITILETGSKNLSNADSVDIDSFSPEITSTQIYSHPTQDSKLLPSSTSKTKRKKFVIGF